MNKRKQRMIGHRARQVASLGHSASEVMNVGGGALSLVGQPEMGLPLMMAGKFTGKASKLLKRASKTKKNKK